MTESSPRSPVLLAGRNDNIMRNLLQEKTEDIGTMSTMIKRKKRFIISLLMAVLMSVVFLSTGVEAANDDFNVNVNVQIKNNKYTFDVEAYNKESRLDGRVVIMCSLEAAGYMGYSKPVSIGSGSTEYVSIDVPITGTKTNVPFYLYICNDDDEIVYQEKFNSIAEYTRKNMEEQSHSYSNLDKYDIERLQGYMEGRSGGISGLLSLLIVLYVALVGPIIYLILKAMKKRELMWIVIPGITLAFLLIMFLIGLSTGSKKDSVKSIEVHNAVKKETSAYIFGYSASPKKWSIKTKENYETGRAIMDGFYNIETRKFKGEIEEGISNMTLSFYPREAFESVCFELKKECTENGRIDIKGSMNDPNSVVVTNNTGYDLDYVYVGTYFGYEVLEDVKSGDTRTITLDYTGASSSHGSQVYNTSLVENEYIRPAYNKNDIKEASELAAVALGLEASLENSEEAVVFGITTDKPKTDKDNVSYKGFYNCYSYGSY